MSYRPSYEGYNEGERTDERRHERPEGYRGNEDRRPDYEGGPGVRAENYDNEHERRQYGEGSRYGDDRPMNERRSDFGDAGAYRRRGPPGRDGGEHYGRPRDGEYGGRNEHGGQNEEYGGSGRRPHGEYDGPPQQYGGRQEGEGSYRNSSSGYGRSSEDRTYGGSDRNDGPYHSSGGGTSGPERHEDYGRQERRENEQHGSNTNTTHRTSNSNSEPHYGNESAKAGADAARRTQEFLDKEIQELAGRIGVHLNDIQADKLGDFARMEIEKLTGKKF